jgi:hypothetical protein
MMQPTMIRPARRDGAPRDTLPFNGAIRDRRMRIASRIAAPKLQTRHGLRDAVKFL